MRTPGFRHGFRSAIRQVTRRPGWALVIIGTLALGVGANTAAFSVTNAVLFKPLAFEAPEQLVFVWTTNQRRDVDRASAPYDDVPDWRQSGDAIQALSAYQHTELTVQIGDNAVRVVGVRADHQLFPLLGVAPVLGRGILQSDEERGAGRIVVLSHEFSRRFFGDAVSAIGEPLYIEGDRHEVAGVLPAGFRFPNASGVSDAPSVWLPLSRPDPRMARQGRVYTVVGRLRDRALLAEAEAQLRATADRLEQQYPRTHTGWSIRLAPVGDAIAEGSRSTLLLLLVAVGFILLIACANASMLLLVRGVARLDEFETRLALGASRRDLCVHVIAEGTVIGAIGGGVGIGAGLWTSLGLRQLLSGTIPRAQEFGFDWRVAVFGVLVTLFTIVAAGVLPAAIASSRGTSHQGRSPAGRRGVRRWHRAFVVAEVAVATLLLVAAAGLARRLVEVQRTDLGFIAEQVLTFEMHLPASTYRDPARVRTTHAEVLERLSAAPGVVAAGGINILPPSTLNLSFTFTVDGDGGLEDRLDARRANFRVVTPEYFPAVSVPLLRGRAVNDQDAHDSLPVAVINQRFAARYFGTADPVGRSVTVNYGMGSPIARQIVGVVGDVRQAGPDQDPNPEVYIPYTQEPFRWMSVAVRVRGDAAAFATSVPGLVHQTDPMIAVDRMGPMTRHIETSIEQPRLRMNALAAIAALGLLLAMSGVFAVTGFATGRRRPEFAVRVALGATRQTLSRSILREHLVLAGSGAAAGVLVAAVIGAATERVIGIAINPDVETAVVAALGSILASLLATWHPTARAAAVDPAQTLRA